MARDRDHRAVATKARRDARRIQAAWDNYVAKAADLAAIRECPSIWPNSVADVAPTRCQLLEGHVQQKGTRHRHRMPGSQVTVEWD